MCVVFCLGLSEPERDWALGTREGCTTHATSYTYTTDRQTNTVRYGRTIQFGTVAQVA